MEGKSAPNVFISGNILWQARQIALACQERGFPYELFTTYYAKEKGFLYRASRLLEYAGLPQFRKSLNKRSYPKLDPKYVRSFIACEILHRTFRNTMKDSTRIYYVNSIYDSWVSRHVDRCDIFYGYEDSSLSSIRRAREAGVVSILELRSLQPLYIEILLEEAEILGLPSPGHTSGRKFDILMERKSISIETADNILVYNNRFKRYLTEALKIPDEKIIVSPLGADLELFHPLQKTKKQDRPFRILFVGYVVMGKGAHYLLQAVKELDLKNIEFQIVGLISPDMKPILEKYEGYFTYIGTVPRPELIHFYNEADLFVLPSIMDNFPLVIYEAMSCGVPVVVTENSGVEIQDGKEGFVVPIRDVEVLKQKILALYENEELRREMGQNAQEWAEDHSLARYRERMASLLLEIHQRRNTER